MIQSLRPDCSRFSYFISIPVMHYCMYVLSVMYNCNSFLSMEIRFLRCMKRRLIRENWYFLVSSVKGCVRSFVLVQCSLEFLAMSALTTHKTRLKLGSYELSEAHGYGLLDSHHEVCFLWPHI